MTTQNDLLSNDDAIPPWLQRLDEWCERFGDAVNPILVKETRQAMKSRHFVITFSVLLIASLGWTIAGSLSLMPGIYTTPSAPRMLIGYYAVLALPMLLVVPLAAYRSLEGEIDDGTLELLSITALSPWQIVLGKLASAVLQMLMYFVALFPCVAYAYTLRGVDLPTTLIIMGILFVAGLLLTIVGLFFAPMTQGRSGRVVTLLALIFVLLFSEWCVGFFVVEMIFSSNPMPPGWTGFLVIAAIIVTASIGHLLLTVTAAQLTPVTENRSTPIRLSLLLLTGVGVALSTYAAMALGEDSPAVWGICTVFLAGLWTVAGCMMAAESPVMTPRIRRELPASFLSRMCFTFLTPGPASGLMLTCSVAIMLAIANYIAVMFYASNQYTRPMPARTMQMFGSMLLLATGYLIIFWTCSRWIVAVLRLRSNPRVEVGIAAMIVVMVFSVLVPYSAELMWNDYRSFEHSFFQTPNWAWTLAEAADRSTNWLSVAAVIFVALLALTLSVSTIGSRALPSRTATPQRVIDERNRPKDEDISPFDIT